MAVAANNNQTTLHDNRFFTQASDIAIGDCIRKLTRIKQYIDEANTPNIDFNVLARVANMSKTDLLSEYIVTLHDNFRDTLVEYEEALNIYFCNYDVSQVIDILVKYGGSVELSDLTAEEYTTVKDVYDVYKRYIIDDRFIKPSMSCDTDTIFTKSYGSLRITMTGFEKLVCKIEVI
ncbi:hypothetical protein HNP86_001806 [Methanococcus maripaludis]|uniref:Uncharacterized protein n=1 Tax=Methanococcus maripaludis TaxID=39152 RepID=A0A7J9NWE8_METMI|nr:hypothetical protein [Methanococcus maripaludis]MBA2851647.1 hypothetical protein [Methanococcus maripaludis]